MYHQVQVEPELQVVSTKKVFGWILLWMAFGVNVLHEHCFVDVQVFNPYAPSYVNSISAAYKHYEGINYIRDNVPAYGQRKLEHISFTPVMMSGGFSPATTFYQRLPSLLASKWGDEYCVMMGWLHILQPFSLLRSARDQPFHAYKEICGHLLLLMYMAKITAGTTTSTHLPLIGLQKIQIIMFTFVS